MNTFLHRLGSPQVAYQMAGFCLPWFSIICVLMMIYGVVGGLFLAPPDAEQGDAFRMIYIHVPAAFLSLMIYGIIFVNSVIYLVWHIKLADIVAKCSASVGATYTIIALFSGALWGKPMWGTWWIWDARLTAELILLFLYLGYMGLRNAIREPKRAAKASAILAIIGMVDIPIIHFSVEWWATLHQGATLAKFSKPSIAPEMLYPLLAMLGAFVLFYAAILCVRVRLEILKRERKAQWVQEWFVAQTLTRSKEEVISCTFSEKIRMSHYAAYIWPCYVFAFCLLGVQVILAFIEWKMTWKKALKSHKDKHAS